MKIPAVRVYQIYFHERQLPFLSPDFTPYLNKANDGFYESGVFRREFQRKTHLAHDYTGFVSWRFEKKSFVAAKDFLGMQADYPGKAVYFLNPFPELASRFKNVWLQGADSHPGLLQLSQKIFDHAGIRLSLADHTNGPNEISYCNYWYGTQSFWESYMGFCNPFFELFEDKKSPFFEEIRSGANYHGGGTLIPFFMERLFTTFLHLNPDMPRLAFDWTSERQRGMQEKMRHQLNVSEAKLDEIAREEENRPHWRRFLRRKL